MAKLLVKEKTGNLLIMSWQGLADEFGTFDWASLYQEMCVLPRVVIRVLNWQTSLISMASTT